MAKSKRATVYFEPDVHRAVRLKAAETERSISDIVDEALRSHLLEDAEDLEAVRSRIGEPTVTYEALIRSMKESGEL